MLGSKIDASPYLLQLTAQLESVSPADLQRWATLIYEAWQSDRFVFICGNGGSGTTASHMSEDLGKSLLRQDDLHDESKKRLKVLSLTDNVGWIMAVGNDLAYDQIFVQQLMNYGSQGDVVIAISGSGNSANVLNAVDWANRHGLITFGLTGFDGGKLKQIQRDGIHIPLNDMGMVESIHLCLFHWVLDDVFGRINHVGRYVTTA
ncbi:MAG: SIS domain-containing protein [Planctomycetales bacterium]|nr:SIS domain-containing protein [Planctomycetales bacterium]